MNLFDVYPLFNISPVRASGSYVWDEKGERYLDFYGGHAVISIGHSHPVYVEKISAQLQRIGFYSNSVKIPLQQELAKKLGEQSGYDSYNFFMCNSGAEANENAIKLASFYTGKKKIVAFKKSFHGRTSATVAATDDKSIVAPVNETENVIFCELGNAAQLRGIFEQDPVAAVIIEGIQGVGGVRVPDGLFMEEISRLCNDNNALLICDEIQSGYGRSGKFFAHQHSPVCADIITVAKGMGNGFPVAGVLIHPRLPAKKGMLGTTFGGNYLACAAAIAVLDVMKYEQLVENARQMGNYLLQALVELPGIKEVRGRGLMIGVELHTPCQETRNALLHEHKIFTGASSDKNTLRIMPALTVTKPEADQFLYAFKQVLQKHVVQSATPF